MTVGQSDSRIIRQKDNKTVGQSDSRKIGSRTVKHKAGNVQFDSRLVKQ